MRYSRLGASWGGRGEERRNLLHGDLLCKTEKMTKNKIEITPSYKAYRDIILQIKNPLLL